MLHTSYSMEYICTLRDQGDHRNHDKHMMMIDILMLMGDGKLGLEALNPSII